MALDRSHYRIKLLYNKHKQNNEHIIVPSLGRLGTNAKSKTFTK